MSYFCKRIDSF